MKEKIINGKSIIGVFVILLLITFGCSSNKNLIVWKNDSYNVEIRKGTGKSLPIINGFIYDYEKNDIVKTLAAVKIGDTIKAKINEKGFFQFQVQPGDYSFKAVAYPFKVVETKKITVRLRDTIKIKFYLSMKDVELH